MPRGAREKSMTGMYHIMFRGIDKRDIFLDDEDRWRFIEYIKKAQKKGDFEIYGYCLMDNHIHLLIKEGEDIGTSMKRITVGYVAWHNLKHERTGHLFQNRYKSEPVESERYLLTVLRTFIKIQLRHGWCRKPAIINGVVLDNTMILQTFSTKERNDIIRDIYSHGNISIRQLGRVLEVGKNIVERAVR